MFPELLSAQFASTLENEPSRVKEAARPSLDQRVALFNNALTQESKSLRGIAFIPGDEHARKKIFHGRRT
jgi:hypothetical protein